MRDRSREFLGKRSGRTFCGFCPGDLVHLGSRVGLVIARRSRGDDPLILWWDDLSQHSGTWLTGIQDAHSELDPGDLAG